MDLIEVNNVFVAVFEKKILDGLLGVLDTQRTKFWGTGGTVDYVKAKGFNAQSVISGFDCDGRVKSLDRANFVRILADRNNSKHVEELKKEAKARVIASEAKQSGDEITSSAIRDDRSWKPFDLVVVDLYAPDPKTFPESMDIGGQALVRAA